MPDDIVAIARAAYETYVTKDRAAIEKLIAPDFHFTSPLDNRIDRATHLALLAEQRKDQRFRFYQSRSRSRPGIRHL
jgi:uncharacterized protein DUF4440